MRVAVIFATLWLAAVSLSGTMSIEAVASNDLDLIGDAVKTAATLNSSAREQYSTVDLFSRLIERQRWEQARLEGFSVVRTYKVEDEQGKTHAMEVVLMEYRAPATKTFATISARGSVFIRNHVFKQLMKREAGRTRGRQDRDSSITPDNYVFDTLGKERMGGTDCFVVHAIPKRKETYLFDGKIWIDDQDFAIVKVTGHLAKSPSFWIKRVDFVRQYQKIAGFWLPEMEQSTAAVRLYGTRILTIEYRNYTLSTVEGIRTSAMRLAFHNMKIPRFSSSHTRISKTTVASIPR